jgi:carbamate kinase
MSQEEAERRQREQGWTVIEDAGRGWRRVVASPMPKEIVELETIETLLERGIVTITVGGGGIPVIDPGDGNYQGTAAVIDKDYASSLLAQAVKADLFIISTAIEKVAINFGKPNQQWLDKITLSEAKQYLAEGIHFAKGSMAPKIQAIIWYLENGGKQALITNPENIGRALKGETGTWIFAD